EAGLRWDGPPPRVQLRVDGRAAGDVPLPPGATPGGPVILRFEHRFAAGSHLIRLDLDPAVPSACPRQHYALDVLPAIPVLVVDGEQSPLGRSPGSRYLRAALAPRPDPAPAFAVRSVPVAEFTAATLTR